MIFLWFLHRQLILPVERDADKDGQADDELQHSPVSDEEGNHAQRSRADAEHDLVNSSADNAILLADGFNSFSQPIQQDNYDHIEAAEKSKWGNE